MKDRGQRLPSYLPTPPGATPNPDSSPEAVLDLSLETLTSDFLAFLQTMFPDPRTCPAFVVCLTPLFAECGLCFSGLNISRSFSSTASPLKLVGHSMGAPPVLEATANLQKLGYRVSGVAVLDVVEGRFPPLAFSHSVASSDFFSSTFCRLRHRRPPPHARHHLLPAYLLQLRRGGHRLAVGPISPPSSLSLLSRSLPPPSLLLPPLTPSISSSTFLSPLSARLSVPALLQPLPSGRVTWRTNLAATQPFWEGWYTGLSRKFLEVRSGRMLVLAGTDRTQTDREMMVGQMQGE